MWNESEHPRDDIGRFTEKNGYDILREKKRDLWEVSGYKNMPKKVDFDRVADIMGASEELEYLLSYEFAQDLTKEQFQTLIDKNKQEFLAKRQQWAEEKRLRNEAALKAQEEEKAWAKRKVNNVMNNTDASETAAQRLIDVVDRYYAAYEKAMGSHKYDETHNGYVGNSRSVRATNAETDGKFPAGRAANILGITSLKLKKYLSPSEWHHTGALYNATDYYDISELCGIMEDLQDEDSAADIRKDYSADSIEKFEAIYGVKIK